MYRIKNWAEIFENHKTRILKSIRYVSFPNSMDGLDYIRLMGHPNGAAHLGVWFALVLISSRCEKTDKRGDFSQNGLPMSLNDISMLSRVPFAMLQEAMDRFVKELFWIEIDGAIRRESGADPAFSGDIKESKVSKVSKVSTGGAPLAPLESEPDPLEVELKKTAQVLRERHPKHRTCGQKEVEKLLRAILKPLPSKEKLPMLQTIDENHKSQCDSFDWKNNNGQYAKGLANWLAPTQQRYLSAAPEDSEPPKPVASTGYQQPDYILQIIAEGGEAFEILRKQRLSQGRDPYTGNRIVPGEQLLT